VRSEVGGSRERGGSVVGVRCVRRAVVGERRWEVGARRR
jgi:hypothetical protein